MKKMLYFVEGVSIAVRQMALKIKGAEIFTAGR